MHKLSVRVVLTSAVLAAAPAAHAAHDYLLEIDGVKGESKASASIETFQWSMATAAGPFDPFQPAYVGGVRVASGDLDGDGLWQSLTLTARTPDGAAFHAYEMKDVLISSYSVSGNGGAADQGHKEWILIESVSSPLMRWAPPTAEGGRGDWIVGHWENDSGRFVGDNAVFGAFDDLGAVRLADGTLTITAAVPEPGTWALWLAGGGLLVQRLRRQRQTRSDAL